MAQAEEFIVFGDVVCFVARTGSSSNPHAAKDNMHLEKKRFALITRDQAGALFLEIFKDKSKYKKSSPKFSDRLTPMTFCGVTQGNIANDSDKASKKIQTYMAMIFTDYTFIVMTPKESAISASIPEWENRCAVALGHVRTKRVHLEVCPMKSDSCESLSQGSSILLGLTKHRLSLCCLLDHHRCLHSWSLDTINVLEDGTGEITLKVLVLGNGIYQFGARSPHNVIFNDIRIATGDVAQNRVIQPSYITLGHTRPPTLRQLSDVTRPPSCHKKHACGISRQLIPRGNGPPIPPDLVPEEEYLQPVNETDRFRSRRMTGPNDCTHCDGYEEYMDYGENTGTGEYCVDLNEYVQEAVNNTESNPMGESNPEPKLPRGCRPVFNSATASAPLFQHEKRMEKTFPRRTSLRTSRLDEAEFVECSASSSESNFFSTLERVLQGIAPRVDTLKLPHTQRVQLCIKLYQPSPKTAGTHMESWELFAQAIGLRWQAVDLISTIVRNHRLVIPAAEVVLRHWQYMYNKYGRTHSNTKCPYRCTKEQLVLILREHVGREDLAEMIEKTGRSQSHS